jgi:hypothetical protein
MRISGRSLSIVGVPSVLTVVSFYALALHMYAALGGWPKQIGEFGFPPALLVHSHLTLNYFGVVLFTTLFLCPIAVLLCSLVPRWRVTVPYLLTHFGFFIAAMILMHIAPSKFIDWWWD